MPPSLPLIAPMQGGSRAWQVHGRHENTAASRNSKARGTGWRATWKDFEFEIHIAFGDGENVAAIEAIWGMVGGKAWEMPVVELWKVRDGRVSSQRLLPRRGSDGTRP